MASNRSLAEFNLSQEPHLIKGKQKLFDVTEEGEALFNRIEVKNKEISKLKLLLFFFNCINNLT